MSEDRQILYCHVCKKSVSSFLGGNVIVRALHICPECYEKQFKENSALRAVLEKGIQEFEEAVGLLPGASAGSRAKRLCNQALMGLREAIDTFTPTPPAIPGQPASGKEKP
jgi:hypothetical protein